MLNVIKLLWCLTLTMFNSMSSACRFRSQRDARRAQAMTIQKWYKFDSESIQTLYELLSLSIWLNNRASTSDYTELSERLWNHYDGLSRAFPRFPFYRVPRSSEERVFFGGGDVKPVGNKTINFLFEGSWVF